MGRINVWELFESFFDIAFWNGIFKMVQGTIYKHPERSVI